MLNEKPFVHLFRTPGSYYLYDVNTDAILKIDKDVYFFLSDLLNKTKNINYESTNENNYIIRKIEKMKEDGFLLSTRVKEIVHPEDEIIEYWLKSKLHSLTFQITQNCNLRCKYCVYSGNYINRTHTHNRMTFSTAKKGIDFLISHSKESSSINLGFYGGEPLLEFELIKNIIDYAEKVIEGKELTYSITSNGTLLNSDIIEYFEKHNVSLLISLDGPKEIHDKNRRFFNNAGSFNTLMNNLEKIEHHYPSYFSKIRYSVVIDPECDYACINQFFMSYELLKNSRITSTLVSEKYSKISKSISERYRVESQYDDFVIFLSELNRVDKSMTSPINRSKFDFMKFVLSDKKQLRKNIGEKGHHGGPCIPGVTRLFMNYEGKLYPCERVSESSDIMIIGNIEKGLDIDKIKTLLNIGRITEERCKNCWAFRHCTLCAAFADNLTNFSSTKKTSYCQSVLYQTEQMFKNFCTLNEYKGKQLFPHN